MPGVQIEVQDLRKSFPLGNKVIEVLKGITVKIEPGDMIALVGTSGAGKSTFLHLLGALDSPTSGNVIVDGISLGSLKPNKLAAFRNQTIGFVFQFHHLMPDFTAVENVAMPALIAGEKKSKILGQAQALLERVGLSHRISHRPSELSGGEQQRVALARAIMRKPRLLLADEPTGNLDTKTGQEIHSLMVELNQEYGMTMVVVTHNEDLANRMPRCLHMKDGLLIEENASFRLSVVDEIAVSS